MGAPRYVTLPELIWDMVRENKTSSPEFQALLLFYGREKIKTIYLAERERQMAVPPSEDKLAFQKAIHDGKDTQAS